MGDIFTPLRLAGYQTKIYKTHKAGDAAKYAKDLASQNDLILCCGGDGTLHEVVTGILQAAANTPIGYIPAGTTNDMACSLNIPTDPMHAIYSILNGKSSAQDIGLLGKSQYFTYIAAFGAFTSIPYSTPQHWKSRLGYLAYLLQILCCLNELHPYKLDFVTDSGPHESGAFLYGGVTNAYTVSKIFHFKKEDVKQDDGQLELMLIRCPQNPLDFFRIAANLILRKTDDHLVIFRHIHSATFHFEEETTWTADGEYAGKHQQVSLRCLPGVVQLIHGPTQQQTIPLRKHPLFPGHNSSTT